jgi:hypothetical protein
VIPRPRKLLAAAPLLAAALAGCGTTQPPAARATVMRAPVTAPAGEAAPAPAPVAAAAPASVAVAASASVAASAPAAVPVAAAAAVPAAATPMCDEHGRPLSGNVRGKGAPAVYECE